MAYDKVVDSAQLDAGMTEVAQAIRAKGGTTEQLAWPDGFKAAVESIETGITPTGSVAISENGTYDVTEKATAVVNVLNNRLHFVYNNPADVSGGGNYVPVAASETLKQIRSLESLLVVAVMTVGDAAGVYSCIACNVPGKYGFPGVVAMATQTTLRQKAVGELSVAPGVNAVDAGDDISSGSGRVYITEDGELRIYGNTNAYPIRAGEIVVDVLW